MTLPNIEQPTEVRAAEERRLQAAARVATLRAKQKPLLRFRMGSGKNTADAIFEWPGVLSIYDKSTGRLLCQSAPGEPFKLAGYRSPMGWQGARPVGQHDHGEAPI